MKSYNDAPVLFTLLFVALAAGYFGMRIENQAPRISVGGFNEAAALVATQQNVATKSAIPPDISLGFIVEGTKAPKIAKTPDITFANINNVALTPAVMSAVKGTGIKIVSLDGNRNTFDNNLSIIKNSAVLVCGSGKNKSEASQPAVIQQNGYSVGYLCFSETAQATMAATDTQSGVLLASDPNFIQIVKTAAKKVNSLIVAFNFAPTKNQHTEKQEELAKQAIDVGAEMIVGISSSPAQEISSYGNAPIIYNIGKQATITANLKGPTLSNVK